MVNTVPAVRPVLVAWYGNADAADDQWLWKVHSTWGFQSEKLPYNLFWVSSPLELLHVDFNGIEITMELHQPPHVVNVLVFCDHFTRHIMAYLTPDHMAKTLVKFLWQGYILIFGALVRRQETLLYDPRPMTGEGSPSNADADDWEIG